jgi:hypothetical protein
MNQEKRKAGKIFFLVSNKSISWVPAFLVCISPCSLLAPRASAGDAVVIGYNADGIWTDVTYYRSATRKGGKDYKTEEEARQLATRDVRRRSQSAVAKTTILSSSDTTGFVAVARGQNKSGTDIHGVGRGKTQAEADEKALELLNGSGAGGEQKIIYRYFSHGADSK